jgi:hypothetical protein
MERWLAASILVLLGAAPCRVTQGAQLTVYRCVAGDGAITLQDMPCPPGSAEQARQWRRPLEAPPRPAAAPSALPEASEPAPEAPAPVAARRAPAPRFECLRPDGDTYESADGQGEPRWVPLWTVGLDPRAPAQTFGRTGARPAPRPAFRPGAPAAPPDAAALGPGVWIRDACRVLGPGEICARRREQIDALARRAHNVGTGEASRLRAQRGALLMLLDEECG